MWINLKEGKFHSNSQFTLFGKGLCLAQNFEQNCKYILMRIGTADAYINGKISSFKDIRSYGDKLLSHFLGKTITGLSKYLELRENDIKILTEAKNSRNYIAHESVNELIYETLKGDGIFNKMNIYYNHIKNLAEGDNMVSGWAYNFDEREVAPHYFMKEYVDNMIDWVFSDYSPEEYKIF